MRLSILEITKRALSPTGFPAPASLITTTDDTAPQLVGIAYEIAIDMLTRYDWQALKKEALIFTKAGDSQGDLLTLLPDFHHIVNETVYNTTQGRPLVGPIGSNEWQLAKRGVTAPSQVNRWWRVFGDQLQIFGQTVVDEHVTFEYISSYWVQKADKSTKYDTIKSDTDIPILDAEVMIAGIRWKWLAANKFAFADAQAEYEKRMESFRGIDGGKKKQSLNSPRRVRGSLGDYPYDIKVTV